MSRDITDTPTVDRQQARRALKAAFDQASLGETQLADAFTRIADAHIRMASIDRK